MGDGGKVLARGGGFGLALGFDMGDRVRRWGWANEGLLNSLAGVVDGALGLLLFGGRWSTGGVQSAHMPLYATVA